MTLEQLESVARPRADRRERAQQRGALDVFAAPRERGAHRRRDGRGRRGHRPSTPAAALSANSCRERAFGIGISSTSSTWAWRCRLNRFGWGVIAPALGPAGAEPSLLGERRLVEGAAPTAACSRSSFVITAPWSTASRCSSRSARTSRSASRAAQGRVHLRRRPRAAHAADLDPRLARAARGRPRGELPGEAREMVTMRARTRTGSSGWSTTSSTSSGSRRAPPTSSCGRSRQLLDTASAGRAGGGRRRGSRRHRGRSDVLAAADRTVPGADEPDRQRGQVLPAGATGDPRARGGRSVRFTIPDHGRGIRPSSSRRSSSASARSTPPTAAKGRHGPGSRSPSDRRRARRAHLGESQPGAGTSFTSRCPRGARGAAAACCSSTTKTTSARSRGSASSASAAGRSSRPRSPTRRRAPRAAAPDVVLLDVMMPDVDGPRRRAAAPADRLRAGRLPHRQDAAGRPRPALAPRRG